MRINSPPLLEKKEQGSRVPPKRDNRTPSSSQQTHHDSKKPREQLQELLDICKQNIAKQCQEERDLWTDEEDLDEEDLLKEEDPSLIEVPMTALSPLSTEVEPSMKVPSPCALSTEAASLFDHLCARMLVMTMDSEQETTLFLQGEAFANSPFSGARVVIQEFRTAPKIFNVTIHATDEAALLIQAHAAAFLELLQDRKFCFGINRMETAPLREEGGFDEQDEKEEESK